MKNYKRIQVCFLYRANLIPLQLFQFQINSKESNPEIIKMSIISISQNQTSSQYYKQDQELDVKSLLSMLEQQIDPEVAKKVVSQVSRCFKTAKNQVQEQCMQIVIKLLGKGYGKEITKNNTILQTMMDKFTFQCRNMQIDTKLEYKLMYILSTIAELIKEAPPSSLCLKKKFIQSLLLIDEQLLEVSPLKKDILAVLGVLYQFISRQIKVLQKFELLRQFKKAILSNYSLIEQNFSTRLFNKALYNLAIQGQVITQAELAKFGIFKTLIRIMGEEQASTLIKKLQSALNKLVMEKTIKLEAKRTQMIAES